MLRRTDNPELFDAIRSAYNKQYPQDKSVDTIFTKELTDEQLSKVTSLKIQADVFHDIKSLKGIEQLTNLTEFSLNGQSPWHNSREFRRIQSSSKFSNYNLDQELDDMVAQYNSGQIEDITPLYKLKNLKKLELKHQRRIKEIDFSNNQNLTYVDMSYCEGLETVKGLESLNVVKGVGIKGTEFEDCKFEFSRCSKLMKVSNFSQLVETLDKNADAGFNSHIFLPSTAYCHIARQNQDACEHLAYRQDKDYVSHINWTEIDKGNVRVEKSSVQMLIAKKYADETIKTLFHGENPSNIELVSGVYRWICDNIKYDYEGLEKARAEDPKKKFRKKDSIRSSYVALIDKKAVCTGISNLFNFLMADLGFLAEPCLCSNNMLNDARMTEANHMMSKVYINDTPYYCDATWDLGGKDSRFFCLTKEEMEKTHQFDVSAYGVKSGPSLQEKFKLMGILQTKEHLQME